METNNEKRSDYFADQSPGDVIWNKLKLLLLSNTCAVRYSAANCRLDNEAGYASRIKSLFSSAKITVSAKSV